WKGSDRYLREAMFGPEHPRADGRLGLQSGLAGTEQGLPGFGPFGTAGQHCFDPHFPTYLRIAAINAVRQQLPPLRYGRQYPRPISFLGKHFGVYGPGEIIAWSRILDDEEALCVLNGHGTDARGADVLVDPTLNQPGSSMTVVLSTAQTASAAPAGLAPLNSKLPVRRKPDGTAYVEIGNLPASEMLVLVNHLP